MEEGWGWRRGCTEESPTEVQLSAFQFVYGALPKALPKQIEFSDGLVHKNYIDFPNKCFDPVWDKRDPGNELISRLVKT